MIPTELKRLRQWVCWQAVPDPARPDHPRKTPVNPMTGGGAMSNNPDTWADYDTAVRESKKYTGIGFMFANGYFGVDIDNVEDAIEDYKNGSTDNIVAEFIGTLRSYAEYSQSGRGIHIICRGKLPPGGRRKGNVEMYDSGRFFVMTGNAAAEYTEIADGGERIKPLHEKYIGGARPKPNRGPAPVQPVSLSDAEILQKAGEAKAGAVFQALYNGEWEAYFNSQSEADLSLCNRLAYWTGKDAEAMDRLFRASGLMRDKWDREQSGSTYGKLTIEKAIRDCESVYTPPQKYYITVGGKKKPKLYSFDDTGNAERFIDLFGGSVRYNYTDKSWMWYDGRRWKYDDSGEPKRMVDEMLDVMRTPEESSLYVDDTGDLEKQYQAHVKRSRSSAAKTACLKEAEHLVPITSSVLDVDPYKLNTPSGVLDLVSGAVQPHNSAQNLSKICNAEYTEKRDTPVWDAFLAQIFNQDEAMIRFVQRAVGYSLTGVTDEQCMFICIGDGRNGKSTLLNVFADILGDYACNMQPESLAVKNGGSAVNSDIARLRGVRFATTVEPDEGMRLAEGLVKQLTGGDVVTARRLYGNEFEFRPQCKIWMAANHKPIIRGTDLGIWRRIYLIPFTVQIPDHMVDKSLKYKLRDEMPGILKWMADGCAMWQREGLNPPLSVQSAGKDYQHEMDVISRFVDECCERSGYETVRAADLYAAYKRWATENNEYCMSSTRFGKEISGRFDKRHSMHGWVYVGLKISNYKIG